MAATEENLRSEPLQGGRGQTLKKHRLNRRLKGVYDAKEEMQPSGE
jgi:hypothetical protein